MKTISEAMLDFANSGSDFRIQGDEVASRPVPKDRIPEPLSSTLANIEKIRTGDGFSPASAADDPKAAGKALVDALDERLLRSLANIEAMASQNPFGLQELEAPIPVRPKRTELQSILLALSSAYIALAQTVIRRDESVGPELIEMLTEASGKFQAVDNDETAARIVESLIKAIEALNGPARIAN